MKYFIDTEFIEGFHKPLFGKRRHFIDLISIGIVADDGREYYAISNEFNPNDADDWVKKNVIYQLEPKNTWSKRNGDGGSHSWKSNKEITQGILEFMSPSLLNPYQPIEFYAYYADYDWVVFCSLFGRMIDLPKGFPMYCRDLKQTLDEKVQELYDTVPMTLEDKVDLFKKKRIGYPKQTNEHNALGDAKWNKALYEFLITL